MKKIAAISLISIFIMSGCAVHNDETSIGKFGLAYKSNIQRKLDNQYYTGNDSNLLIVFYVQIMPDDFVMQLHRF